MPKVVPVPVGVDDPSHRQRGERAQLVQQLIGLDMRGAGVDDQGAFLSEDHAHVEIE